MNKAITIVIVDGRELVRHGLRHMLEPEEDMKVVGDCASAVEAISKIAGLHPNIVLLDMPGTNRVEAIRSLKRKELAYDSDIIILAESLDYRGEALQAGAASYLRKNITAVELAQVIRQVYRNRHSSKERGGLVEEAVELVIPPPANATWLLRFMCHLGEILHEEFASIICTIGSWDRGPVITVQLQPDTPVSRLS